AEDRVEDRRGETALVRAVDSRRPQADVVLLGVLPLEAESRPREPPDRLARELSLSGGDAVVALSEERDEALVTDVPRRRGDDARPDVRSAMVGRERSARHRLDALRAPDHRPPERMPAEDRLGGEVVDEVVRRVLDHRDLLEHDLALGVDVLESGAK